MAQLTDMHVCTVWLDRMELNNHIYYLNLKDLQGIAI